jgi:hypothetical protein
MKLPSLYILGVLTLLTSCKKFLDVKPKGKLIPTEIADFNHLLDNNDIVQAAFLDNNGGSNLGYLTDNTLLTDGLGKIFYKANNHPNVDRYNAYTFREPYNNPNVNDYFWESTYRSMKYFNNVIDGVNGIKNASNEAEANSVIAQALVNRAWGYFHAAIVYGPVYKPGTSNGTKVLPYVTSADISVPVPALSTQEEVFAKVANDLYAALPNIPAVTNYPSRPNKVATQAMLAYYHLFTQKYDSVAYYANLAWTAAAAGGVDKILYDFNTLSYATPANPSNSQIVSPDSKIQLPNSREILFFRNPDYQAGRINSSYPSVEFVNLFDQTNDLRFKYYLLKVPGYKTTFSGVTYDDGDQYQYYRGGGTSPKFQITAGFTYPELLLMRAEGYARTNRLAEAIGDLNTLRRYRYVTGTPPLTVGSQDQVINQVLEERRRELPLGQVKRFMDLKRLCLEPGKPWSKTKIVHTVGTDTYEGTIDSHFFTLPISNTILKFNSNWGIPLDNRPF